MFTYRLATRVDAGRGGRALAIVVGWMLGNYTESAERPTAFEANEIDA